MSTLLDLLVLYESGAKRQLAEKMEPPYLQITPGRGWVAYKS